MTLATIQVDTYECLGIDTEADSTLGETGQVIELQTLSGFALTVGRNARTFTHIGVVIHGARADGRLAVFQETCGACLLPQNPNGHGQSQGGLVHCVAPLDSNSCVP